MSRPWDDCRFFIINQCRNGLCKFRHFEGAKTATICLQWENGLCQNILCPYRHVVVREKGAVPCHYERLPQGCTNSDCQFKHIKPRDLEAIDLQKKLAQFLAEHEMSKKEVEKPNEQKNGNQKVEQKQESPEIDRKRKLSKSSSSEDDLAAMRARILQQQMKSKSNGIVKKVKIEEKVEEKPKPEPTKPVVKRRIVSKSHYSEDEASDISLDELTDEEPEDLRTTLNKSKKNTTRVIENDISTRQINKDDEKSKRKITQKSTLNRGGRIISIRKTKGRLGEVSGDDSRPSSSEWIERKITVKKSVSSEKKKNLPNRRITNIKKSKKEITSESEYSDTQSTGENDSPHRTKRKPNLTWVTAMPAEETGIRQRLGRQSKDLDDPKKIMSNRLDRFANSGIVRQVPNPASKNPIKSRLGHASDEAKRGVKSRLGEVRPINQTKPAQNKSDKEEVKDEIPVKRKKLILIKKKKKEENEKVEKENVKTPPRISPPPEPEQPAIEDEPDIEEFLEKSPKKKRRNSSASKSPSQKPALERRSSRRRNSSAAATSPRIRKTRKDILDSSNLDDFEKELLDNPDDLYIGSGELSDDDLFDDL